MSIGKKWKEIIDVTDKITYSFMMILEGKDLPKADIMHKLSSIVLQGTWFLQAGLCLYTEVFAFKGCHKIMVSPESENAELKCDLEEDGLRGVALVNLLFIGHAIGVLLVSFGEFGLLSSHRDSRHCEASGPLLTELHSDSALMRTLPEFELE
ncbi:hypothetical protein GH714_021520 [Hevea brasiliensis]|uniref:Uncharacterized protein n=1 Tax=Hevea brasiliensis TaxID=3981 RepID=A0A6A6ML53_HEVBR|nr:hypothetical protein GH714_021520 [Hevea brasiliensis]